MRAFYRLHYRPSRAILAISADLDEELMLDMAEEYFGDIEDNNLAIPAIAEEPVQREPRRLEVERQKNSKHILMNMLLDRIMQKKCFL